MSDAATMRCLVIGDIIGKPGRLAIEHALGDLRQELAVDFVIANGENMAAGMGLTPSLAEGLLETGVDVITSGNHSPTLGRPIAMASIARAAKDAGTPLFIDSRGQKVAAALTAFPFVPNRYRR